MTEIKLSNNQKRILVYYFITAIIILCAAFVSLLLHKYFYAHVYFIYLFLSLFAVLLSMPFFIIGTYYLIKETKAVLFKIFCTKNESNDQSSTSWILGFIIIGIYMVISVMAWKSSEMLFYTILDSRYINNPQHMVLEDTILLTRRSKSIKEYKIYGRAKGEGYQEFKIIALREELEDFSKVYLEYLPYSRMVVSYKQLADIE